MRWNKYLILKLLDANIVWLKNNIIITYLVTTTYYQLDFNQIRNKYVTFNCIFSYRFKRAQGCKILIINNTHTYIPKPLGPGGEGFLINREKIKNEKTIFFILFDIIPQDSFSPIQRKKTIFYWTSGGKKYFLTIFQENRCHGWDCQHSFNHRTFSVHT